MARGRQKFGFIVRYMNWRHQMKLAGSSFKAIQRTMVLLAKGVGAVELCKRDAANVARGPGSFTEEEPARDQHIEKFFLLPRKFLNESFQRTGKFPKTFALLCTNMLWNSVSNKSASEYPYFLRLTVRGPSSIDFQPLQDYCFSRYTGKSLVIVIVWSRMKMEFFFLLRVNKLF